MAGEIMKNTPPLGQTAFGQKLWHQMKSDFFKQKKTEEGGKNFNKDKNFFFFFENVDFQKKKRIQIWIPFDMTNELFK